MFPGSFIHNPQNDEWVEGNVSQLGNDSTQIFYSYDEASDHVFIATKSSVEYDFEKGYIWNRYLPVHMQAIDQERAVLKPWLRQHFPTAPIGYLMYGYYTI
jgi:hypothetical protein